MSIFANEASPQTFSTDFHNSFESRPSRKPFPPANLYPTVSNRDAHLNSNIVILYFQYCLLYSASSFARGGERSASLCPLPFHSHRMPFGQPRPFPSASTSGRPGVWMLHSVFPHPLPQLNPLNATLMNLP